MTIFMMTPWEIQKYISKQAQKNDYLLISVDKPYQIDLELVWEF
ncbi:MAG: hypothetical protein ACRDDW_04170 [Candidatus Rhabdochlamydia sp.]